jgi:hypothetical protein
MPTHTGDRERERPILDISSYARRGPGRRDKLTSAEIAVIARTVSRTPEVMVKVLTRGGQSLRHVQAHLAYLNRDGDLEIETDQGERVAGKGVEKQLLDDWDLDVEEARRTIQVGPRRNLSPPKLVHKILFSMPPGTPPDKVLTAVKNFAREEFAFKHRYAMVLHTDEPHPHVHMVVKAVSEQGERLHIRKATLREWRLQFARHLRLEGVAANATERAVRGRGEPRKLDTIYRAAARGESTHMRHRTAIALANIQESRRPPEPSKAGLVQTRRAVEQGWRAVIAHLAAQGDRDLSTQVSRFLEAMRPVRTERELMAERLVDLAGQARLRRMEKTR